ncbi:Hypothetical predicted protein [Prunus dulcis]|uniref:Uncharacterized protein n=1 Tax=Prunus dulcis TaxID=3755 RepID=A0A5E4G4S5_PRUDU|nr:hypothetical protein L3X38_003780 [Prunus dulcis]VVA34726.1 Hypothetical predicted protein [Prunus dulcis]
MLKVLEIEDEQQPRSAGVERCCFRNCCFTTGIERDCAVCLFESPSVYLLDVFEGKSLKIEDKQPPPSAGSRDVEFLKVCRDAASGIVIYRSGSIVRLRCLFGGVERRRFRNSYFTGSRVIVRFVGLNLSVYLLDVFEGQRCEFLEIEDKQPPRSAGV